MELVGLALLLLTQQIGLAVMALTASIRGRRTPTPLFLAMALGTFILYNMAFYTTPVIADVYLFRLDYDMNYILYDHALFFLVLSVVVTVAVVLDELVLDRLMELIGRTSGKREHPKGDVRP